MRKPLLNHRTGDFRIYSRGRLPHWQVEEGLYCVTWRLADSLPRHIAERLHNEYQNLMAALGPDPTAAQRAAVSLDYFHRMDQELDKAHGSCVLRDPRAARIVRDSLLLYHGRRYELLRWAVMPNHVHAVFRLRPGELLWQVMKALKGASSHDVNLAIGRAGTLWQREYHDTSIRDERELANMLEYVKNNPAAAGLRDWPWVG